MVFINAGYLIPYFWYFMQLNVIKYVLGYNHVINYNIHLKLKKLNMHYTQLANKLTFCHDQPTYG